MIYDPRYFPSYEELRLMLCSLARQLFEARLDASYWRTKARQFAWDQDDRVYITPKGYEALRELDQNE